MIQLKDVMLIKPCFLSSDQTIYTARSILRKSQFEVIPVVNSDGTYAGLLKTNDVQNEKVSDTDSVLNYLDTSPVTVKQDSPLTILKELNTVDGMPLPVLDKLGCLVGLLPRPKFLLNVHRDIIKGLQSVFNDDHEDFSVHGIIVVDDEGQVVVFNKVAEEILGLKGNDVYGIHINKIIYDSRLSEVAKKGHPHKKDTIVTEKGITLFTNRFPLFNRDILAGAIGIFKDITEHEKLKENIRKLRNINRSLVEVLESIDDGIIVVDSEGTVVRVNSAFEKITGLTAQRCLWFNIRNFNEVPSFFINEVLGKHRSASFIHAVNDREYLVACNFIYDADGNVTYIVSLLKDIDQVNELVNDLQVTQEIASRYYSEIENLPNHLNSEDMIANSNAMKRIVNLALKVAKVDSSILIMGETGVGKEVLARAIHKCSLRMAKSFIKLNCGAIPPELLESELFGYEAGAFTGAKREGKPGLIELADGGTLFLDEIGDLPMNIQVKFLRVLQEREIQKVGGVAVKKVDFRLIAATNKPLEDMVKQNTFREDLFYRLNVVPVVVPPLRNRKEDIVPLIIFFLNKFNKKYGMNKKIAPEVIQSFLKYDWPGNVRELENTIERLIVTSDKKIITFYNLQENTKISKDSGKNTMYLKDVLEQTEKQLLIQAFQQCRTTREMADVLGISQSAVVKKMQKYEIKSMNTEFVNEARNVGN